MTIDKQAGDPTYNDAALVTSATERPLVEPADQVVAPDPLDEVRPVAACLPNDADDQSDAGSETTDHDDEGWRADPLAKP